MMYTPALNEPLILAIDQGTTSSRAIVFNKQGSIVSVAQMEFEQFFPNNGWVEHDAEEIWSSTLEVSRRAFKDAEAKGGKVVAIGITNQRETTILWDKATGKPLAKAIVWQDRRTADFCQKLKKQGAEAEIQARTGLLLDPYFSASKLRWLLEEVPGARQKAEAGEALFGTVDSYLIARLSNNQHHLTDATNASRTCLFNIHENIWDDELLKLFEIPRACLPKVLDCADDFGLSSKEIFGREIPIYGVAGDQHAAAIGQNCFNAGDIKSTYGTGCFVLMNTGEKAVTSTSRMLTTIAYRLNGESHYALEGAIFMAGAAIQWLRDGLGIIKTAGESEAMAAGLENNGGVYLVPAYTGLGAPYWQPDARGLIHGLTRATGPQHIVRATLEAVAYQTHDLLSAMAADALAPSVVRVDGGMVENNWFTQFLADTLDVQIDRPQVLETTALGAAYLAGLKYGLYDGIDDLKNNWQLDAQFKPQMSAGERESNLRGWQDAVRRVLA